MTLTDLGHSMTTKFDFGHHLLYIRGLKMQFEIIV
jgi:hypothetical protein